MSDLAALRAQAKALRAEGRREAAADAWAAVLAAAPDDAEALFRVGEDKLYGGWTEEADALFGASFARRPDPAAAGMAVLACLYAGTPPHRRQAAIDRWVAAHSPAGALSVRRYGSRDPKRRLRIAYLSADFHAHPAGLALWALFKCHDRSRVEVHAVSTQRHDDAIAVQLRDAADLWHDMSGCGDDDVAAAIAAAGIDVLIAPAPHFDDNRIGVLRRRPAPVQVVGYTAATGGLPEADYFLGDPVTTPRGGGEWFAERVLRLPCFTVVPIPAEMPAVAPLPAARTGTVTFGCFGSPAKIATQTVSVWCRVLHAVPGARLLLKYRDAYAVEAIRRRILDLFAVGDIDGNRIVFVADRDTRRVHLAAYSEVDIALDSFPFTGVTTTFEALLMGVPVVTLLGTDIAGRSAASILRGAGLSPFVALDADDYVMRAAELASDLPRLNAFRGALRARLERAPICDARRHTRWLERYLRAMWRRYCAQ